MGSCISKDTRSSGRKSGDKGGENAANADNSYMETLNGFDRICIIDIGARGTGHQSAVIKLLDSLARIGWNKPVYLSYNAQKTKYFAPKFGKANELDEPLGSYELYNEEWEVDNYKGFPLVCIPNKGGPRGDGGDVPTTWSLSIADMSGLVVPISKGEFNDYKDHLSQHKGERQDNPAYSELEWAKMIKWTEKAWPTLEELASEPKPWGPLNVKKNFRENIIKQNDSVVRIEYAPKLPSIAGRTLTMFAANDVGVDDFNDYYVGDVTNMVRGTNPNTNEQDQVIMIFQPFVWATDVKRIRVQEGKQRVVDDVAALMEERRQKAVYRLDVNNRNGVALNAERNIAMYYSEENFNSFELVSENLIKALVKYDEKYPELNTLISIIGTISDDKWNALENIARPGNIKFERVGRITDQTRMTAYQRTSDFFITEGANTSQELYAIGTPTLSTHPDGHTTPWTEAFPEGDAAKKLVFRASKNLLAYDDDNLDSNPLIEFIKQTRENGSVLNTYFRDWSECLRDTGSDQVVGALKEYHDFVCSRKNRNSNLASVQLY